MPRTQSSLTFSRRTNRLNNLRGSAYHSLTVGEGIYLVYRRGRTKSMWYVRRREDGSQKPLGVADDFHESDGEDVLTYYEAVLLANKRAKDASENGEPMARRGGSTVGDAVESKLEELKSLGNCSIEARRKYERDILPCWEKVPLQKVTRKSITKWINSLIDTPRKSRGGREWVPKNINEDEDRRRRRATVQRTWNSLRAALNYAVKLGWVDDGEWVKFGNIDKGDEPPRDEFPAIAECRKLIQCADAEFKPILEATLLTGAAYKELCSMHVRHYRPDTGHIQIINQKRQDRDVPLTPDGLALFDAMTKGKSVNDYVFTHSDGRRWTKSEQKRPLDLANAKAEFDGQEGRPERITLTRLRHAYGSILVTHGASFAAVQRAMGHVSIRTTERHYARLNQSTVDEQIRSALPSL